MFFAKNTNAVMVLGLGSETAPVIMTRRTRSESAPNRPRVRRSTAAALAVACGATSIGLAGVAAFSSRGIGVGTGGGIKVPASSRAGRARRVRKRLPDNGAARRGAVAAPGDGERRDDPLTSLRERRARLRNERLTSRREAAYEASRRTSLRGTIGRRIKEGERERRRRERRRLEKLYAERKERRSEARRREGEQRRDGDGRGDRKRRGMPVLDRPYVDAPPLLIGGTTTLPYGELTPFQRGAIDAARACREERAGAEGASDGGAAATFGIDAAPVVAVVDGYTSVVSEALQAPPTPSSRRPGARRRYATLAVVEVAGDDGGTPSTVRLTGVGRAFLRNIFSSEDAATTHEESELNELLARIRALDRQERSEDREEDKEHATEPEEEDDDSKDDDDDQSLVIMAEFDLALDGASDAAGRKSSPVHALAELYSRANRVYRLHEERRKLVAGLRAGEARLRPRREGGRREAPNPAEECPVDLYEDCDGLGGTPLLGGVPAGRGAGAGARAPAAAAPPPRSRLEALENYGLGWYGATSAVPDLARRLSAELAPYYSPAHRGREEHEAEVASLAALRSLEAYASAGEVAEALVVPASAAERLELVCALMMRHRDELDNLVEIVSRELVECGEECTDLW